MLFQKIRIKLLAVRFQKCVLKETRCGFWENGFDDNSDRKVISTYLGDDSKLNLVRAKYHCSFSEEGIVPFSSNF